MRDRAATGVYVGGFAWVENLKADTRPDKRRLPAGALARSSG